MKVGSLFSGVGGLDLGLELSGMDILFHCEKDDWRREVLNERFGKTTFEDVSEIYYGKPKSGSSPGGFFPITQNGREAGSGLSGSIDLLCGGFPCQDLSVAGRRKGLAGERSGLFFEFARIADESRPEYILIENVPGLLSSHEGKDFNIVLQTLYELGYYDISWRILNSQHFGVPQRRRRVFIIGRRTRGTSTREILFESESRNGNYSPSKKTREEYTRVSLSGLGNGGPDDNDAQAGRIIPALTSRAGNTQDDQQTMQLVSTLQAHKNGYRMDADSIEQLIAFHPTQDPISDIVSPAIGTTTHGMAISGPQVGVRRLTPVECERLQGFPDNWTLVGKSSDTKRYAAIGDAVTVNVAEWLGRRILRYA